MPPKATGKDKKTNGVTGTLFQYMRRASSDGDKKAAPPNGDRRGSHCATPRQANGTAKAALKEGTEDDPLVISDDEAPRKKRKLSPSPSAKLNGATATVAKDADSSDEEIEYILPPEAKVDKAVEEEEDIVEVTSCWICGKSLSGMDESVGCLLSLRNR